MVRRKNDYSDADVVDLPYTTHPPVAWPAFGGWRLFVDAQTDAGPDGLFQHEPVSPVLFWLATARPTHRECLPTTAHAFPGPHVRTDYGGWWCYIADAPTCGDVPQLRHSVCCQRRGFGCGAAMQRWRPPLRTTPPAPPHFPFPMGVPACFVPAPLVEPTGLAVCAFYRFITFHQVADWVDPHHHTRYWFGVYLPGLYLLANLRFVSMHFPGLVPGTYLTPLHLPTG